MRWRVSVLLVAGVVAACGGGVASPAASSIAPSMSMPGPTLSPTPSPTLAPTPTPSPTPAIAVVPPSTGSPDRAGAVGLDWALAHTDRAVWGSIIEHGPGGWVHLLTTDGEIPNTPRLMLSPDLEAWDDVTPAGDVVACGDGGSLAASASAWLLRCGGLWRSVDGQTWEPVEGSTDDESPLTELRRVISDGRTFVAVRGEYPADDGIWASADGQAWTKVNLPGAPFVRVDALEGLAGGGFILAGRVADTADGLREAHDMQWYSLPGTQATWTSQDGTDWTALPLGDAFVGGRITGLAADGPGGGIVAVGYVGENLEDGVERIPTVWRSSDKVTWQRLVGPTFALLASDIGATKVVATKERWLVVAARLRDDAANIWDLTSSGVTAGSEDGAAWWATGPIPLEEGRYTINDVASADGRLAILGEANTSARNPTGDARIWVSPPLD